MRPAQLKGKVVKNCDQASEATREMEYNLNEIMMVWRKSRVTCSGKIICIV